MTSHSLLFELANWLNHCAFLPLLFDTIGEQGMTNP